MKIQFRAATTNIIRLLWELNCQPTPPAKTLVHTVRATVTVGTKPKTPRLKQIVASFVKEGQCSCQLHIDCLECERLLLPGVTLHLRFYGSANHCAMGTLTTLNTVDAKTLGQNPPIVVIEKASLFVNKILSDAIKVSGLRPKAKQSILTLKI